MSDFNVCPTGRCREQEKLTLLREHNELLVAEIANLKLALQVRNTKYKAVVDRSLKSAHERDIATAALNRVERVILENGSGYDCRTIIREAFEEITQCQN